MKDIVRDFSADGRRIFNYFSAKDVIRWHKISIKEHIKPIMEIGFLLSLSDKEYFDYMKEARSDKVKSLFSFLKSMGAVDKRGKSKA